MQVSIVIVSYNATAFLDQCLWSCQNALKNISGEIIVVDNDSPEKVVENLKPFYPEVNFIESKENLGFSKANNLGVEHAKGKYVLILNPDTILPENLFENILPFYQQTNNIGALGVRLIDANGKYHPESKRNLPTVLNSFEKLFPFIKFSGDKSYYNLRLKDQEIGQTTVLVGAFMFLEKEIYQKVGGFDERYFMYGEDIDFSYSIELLGYQNYYKGDISVIHYKGESTKKDKKYYKIFFDAMKLFIEKYYKNVFVRMYLKLGIWFRYQIELAKFDRKRTLEDTKLKSKSELYFLPKNYNLEDIKNHQHLVFSIDDFTFQEIISLMNLYKSPSKNFYIATKRYLIGDDVISKR